MPDENSQLQIAPRKELASKELAAFIGMEPPMMIDTIRVQCFKGGTATDFQVAAFISIAVEMKVNPLLPGMLYAYPIQGGGVVPIMGPDGIYKKLSEHPQIEGWDVDVFPLETDKPPTHAVAQIFLKNKTKPIKYTALLSEWKIASNPNWNTRPRHMLQLRALKHAARQIIHGLPFDEDDRAIMLAHEVGGAPGPATQANAEIVDAGTRADPAAVRGKGGRGSRSAPKTAEPATVEAETTTPPAEGTATPPAHPAEPAKAAESTPAAAPAADPKPEQRTKLEKGENLTLKGARILAVKTEDFSGTPGVIAEVETEVFKGTVYDLNGAKMDGEKRVPLAVWDMTNVLDIALLGRGSKLGVLALVEKLDIVKASNDPLGLES